MYTKEQLQSVNSMNKATLRAACKAAAVKGYGKMTVAQMRAAVQRHIEREMKKAAPVVHEARVFAESDKEFKERMLNKVCDEIEPAPVVITPAKVERIVQNGVKRPREGGLCAAVWTDLDKLLVNGVTPTSQQVRDLATARGWNITNALCELSSWRRFNGISRSVLKASAQGKRKPAAKAAPPARRIDGEVDQYTA